MIERDFLLCISRVTFSTEEKNKIAEMLQQFHTELDWNKIIQYAHKNKVIHLMYWNMKRLGLFSYMPKHYHTMIDDSCSCNEIRNNSKFRELERIQRILVEKGIPTAVVKGGYLIDNVYHNRKIRATNDLDMLINRKDINDVDQIMRENGYEVGTFDAKTNTVVPPDKATKLFYKTSMYNLLPYVHLNFDIPWQTTVFDFSFALDFSLDTRPVNAMLDAATQLSGKFELLPEHIFIHMCCHHYREASGVSWKMIGKDLRLIKFCDVREFILQKMDETTLFKAIRFAKEYGLEEAVFFTMTTLQLLYNDGFEQGVLDQLEIRSNSILSKLGCESTATFFDNLFDGHADIRPGVSNHIFIGD